jgi:plasmid maintenance system antidote protein VapI
MSPQFWLNLQVHFDLEVEADKLGKKINTEVHALSVG